VGSVGEIGDAGATVALDGPGRGEGEHDSLVFVLEARVEGDDVAGAAEAVALAEGVTNGDAFHAAAEAGGEAVDMRHVTRKAAAKEVLVGDGHDDFAMLGTEGGNAIGIARVEEPGALEVTGGVEVGLFVSLGAKGKAPAAVAGLQRLIGDDFLYGSVGEASGAHAIVEARGKFEAGAEGDVAAVFGRRVKDPALRTDDDVTKTGDIKDAVGGYF